MEDQRLRQTAIAINRGTYDAIKWSPAIQPNEAPQPICAGASLIQPCTKIAASSSTTHGEQLHVDGNKALLYKHIADLLDPPAVEPFTAAGSKAYVPNRRLRRDAQTLENVPKRTSPRPRRRRGSRGSAIRCEAAGTCC